MPARVEPVEGNGQRGVVGEPLPAPLIVRVADASGAGVPGVPIEFVVVSGGGTVTGEAETDAAGRARGEWTLGLSTEPEHRVDARVAGSDALPAAVFRATASAAAPSTFEITAGDGQSRVAGTPLRDSLVVAVRDVYGNGVPGVRVDWRAAIGGGRVAPTTATTGPTGFARAQLTLGPQPGANLVVATAAGFDSVAFSAIATPPPVLQEVAPAILEPGRLVTFTGSGFAAGPTDTQVRIADTPAFVVSADAGRVTARVPCVASGSSTVSLITNGVRLDSTVPIAVTPLIALATGVSAVAEGPLPGCAELVPPGSFLVIAARTAPASPAMVRLRGRPGPLAATATASAPSFPAMDPHGRILDAAARPLHGTARRASFARAADPAVGDTITMHVPDVAVDPCVIQRDVRARVVARGDRALVLEDVTSPLAGRADSIIATLHAEIETGMLPLLEANFGDALTRIVANDGPRLHVLLTPAVNALSGVSGFASVGDLLDPADCGASNGVPVFYGFVPTDDAAGYGNGIALTRANWYRLVRATVVHETKHIIAFATRVLAGTGRLEERWLEEGTALIAEELYARAVFGYGRNDNTTFRQSLFCERRPDSATFPECRDRPLIMLTHFTLLARHLSAMESRSVFAASAPGDNAYYGAAWSLVRWILDHHAADEGAFLRTLTADVDRAGRANLAAHAGQPFDVMFSGWLAALALDDRPGYTPADPRQTFRGWHMRDIYAGLQQELPILFPRAYPLSTRTVSPGGFETEVRNVPGGTGVFLEIGSLQTARQLLEVTTDAVLAPRVTVLRTN